MPPHHGVALSFHALVVAVVIDGHDEAVLGFPAGWSDGGTREDHVVGRLPPDVQPVRVPNGVGGGPASADGVNAGVATIDVPAVLAEAVFTPRTAIDPAPVERFP